jgi:hypothetical protein
MSNKAEKTVKEFKRPKADTGEQGKKRCRSKKLRPQSAEALALAIQDNRLDNRTRAAQDMIAVRDAIAQAPQEAAKGLVRDTLAANATIMTAVLRELTGPGVKLIGDDGAIHPLIAKTWPELQRATISAARVLASLEREGTGQPPTGRQGEVDITTLILEAQAHENDE